MRARTFGSIIAVGLFRVACQLPQGTCPWPLPTTARSAYNPAAARMRPSVRSRPRSSRDSNNGGDTSVPVTAARFRFSGTDLRQFARYAHPTRERKREAVANL
jgi:hypothetical protein